MEISITLGTTLGSTSGTGMNLPSTVGTGVTPRGEITIDRWDERTPRSRLTIDWWDWRTSGSRLEAALEHEGLGLVLVNLPDVSPVVTLRLIIVRVLTHCQIQTLNMNVSQGNSRCVSPHSAD